MTPKFKRKWKVILLHHTHLDIGYTHTQEEVLKIQFKHLETAMDLIEQNKYRSETSRFRWNPEITWAIDEWIRQAPLSAKDHFIKLVQEGYIGLDGLYGNVLTGLCRPEELMASFQVKHQLEDLTATPIESAMITDIPGWNWGIVTALAKNGIKYLSCGPNRGDRIGYIINDWGDKPFYWVSPSTQERVLVLVHGKGYSWFHSGMKATKNLSRKLNPLRISRYLRKLERQNYPYDTIIIRYNIGADNGPPDLHLSQIVEQWNQQYPNMQLEISTTTKAMAEFEQKYGDTLPYFSGDITPYWEDGAASTARETAIAREAGERLTQASILSALTSQDQLKNQLLDAWKLTFLYNEHTWGAYNSISRPDHPFAKSQWYWKKQKAILAHKNSFTLLQEIIKAPLLSPLTYIQQLAHQYPRNKVNEIMVINTHNWPTTQLVQLSTPFNEIFDEKGHSVECQKLHDGRLAFIATEIPAFGFKRYVLQNSPHAKKKTVGLVKGHFTLQNDLIQVSIDKSYGTIKNIRFEGKKFVNTTEKLRFNQYVFAKKKWGQTIVLNQPKEVSMEILDNGPIVSTIKITKSGFRTKKITTFISITSLSPMIFISNILDRPVSRKKEGIYFQYPFQLENGRIKYDTIYGSATVDKDQLLGANRNFITAIRWVDVSNQDFGVSCALLDAPLFKSGSLVHDPIRMGPPKLCGWLRKTEYTGTLYSYVMNNYWMTNYKADQPGKTLFRYVFLPHKKFSEETTYRFAIEQFQPLLVYEKSGMEPLINQLSSLIANTTLAITAIDYNIENNSHALRIYNPSTSMEQISIAAKTIRIEPHEVITVHLPYKP